MSHTLITDVRRVMLALVCVSGTANAGAAAGTPITQSFAVTHLSRGEAVAVSSQVCSELHAECIVSYQEAPAESLTPGAPAGHLTVTSSPPCLERILAVLKVKDGPQPDRLMRFALLAASKSDSPNETALLPSVEAVIREVREMLPFRSFRTLTSGEFRFESAGVLETDVGDAETGSFHVSIRADAALDPDGRLVVSQCRVRHGDQTLFDTQFHMEFGRPILLGAPRRGDPDSALFFFAAASEEAPRAITSLPPLGSHEAVPFKMTPNHVLDGFTLKIGDLRIASDAEATSMSTAYSNGGAAFEACAAADREHIGWSSDGSRIELRPPWDGGGGRVTTAYCSDGIVLVGGTRKGDEEDGSNDQAMLHYEWAGNAGPTTNMSGSRRPYNVVTSSGLKKYQLNELRAIDPVEGRMLYLATSETGEKAFLVAPFALIPSTAASR